MENVMQLPNGRFVTYNRKNKKYSTQPPNDNYWVEADSLEECLEKAGW
jgi:hypothetical protein